MTPSAASDRERAVASPWARVLVWAPHPDDEVLAAGGLLQRARAQGADVRITIATDGDNQPWVQRVVEGRWTIGPVDRRRWGERRRDEACRGLDCLGIEPAAVRFLGFPDQGLTDALCAPRSRLVAALAGDLASFRPTFVVAPALEDRHRDHAALAVAARLALAGAAGEAALLSYVIHGRRTDPGTLVFAPAPRERVRKRAAILCHRSQVLLHGRRFLGFVDAEAFRTSGAPPAGASDAHPVRGLSEAGGMLRVTLGARCPRGARLRVVAETRAGSRAWTVRVPPSSGPRDSVLVGPACDVRSVLRWFARVDRGAGCYDAPGWREFARATDGEGRPS